MQHSTASIPIDRYRLGLAARLAIVGLVLLADKVLLNGFIDFDQAQTAQGFGGFLRIAQHLGFRFLVALAAAVALFAYVRGGPTLLSIAACMRAAPIRLVWALAHVLLVTVLAVLSYALYRYTPSQLSFAVVAVSWTLIGVAAILAVMLALSPGPIWLDMARALGRIWWYAVPAALLGTAAMQLSQHLWVPTATLTFDLVRHILLPMLPSLTADPSTLVLRTNRFAVQVAEVCSGLEGVGLVLVFSAAWLIYFRREYIFPRALLLIPAGVAAIFALNVLRISALVLIGNAGFPDVAVYGFHSQAGWIAFNVVACGLVFFSRRSIWLNRMASNAAEPAATHNPTAAYLMPLLAILAAGALSHAMSTRFEDFYPLRLVAGLGALALYRYKLATLDWRWSWRGPVVGVCIFILWMVCAHFVTPAAAMPQPLAAMSPAMRALWIAARVAASVLIVPVAEELAYRGYLMRRLTQEDFESLPFQSVRWPALAATAAVFGLAHGALWLPGMAAGVAYGLIVVRRGSVGEAVAAHGTTNALIALSVLLWGQWQLW